MSSREHNVHFDLQKLWEKYEDIAMHFNDLLMRLRSQALAGIAAIATIVGLFTKGGTTNIEADWLIAAALFTALALFWIAIWFLDFFYYNRLLAGAVEALKELEIQSRRSNVAEFDGIIMSTRIIGEFKTHGIFASLLKKRTYDSFQGVLVFYCIVLVTILVGAYFSWHMYHVTANSSSAVDY